MRIEASAPSNIALIKYMGKEPGAGNLPANSSLSYTLEHLRTYVVIEPAGRDEWGALEGLEPIALSETGRKKFMDHFGRLKERWNISGNFRVRSANNFPSDCGLASSASSFAALTLGAFALARKQRGEFDVSREELSALSRLGSGSSCRSLFSPWAEWSGEGAVAFDCPVRLEHAVVIVDGGKKKVSSSDAHRRINTSLLWSGRPARAEARLSELKKALGAMDWPALYEVCWSEFWDMHALFETSRPAFGFMTNETLRVLSGLRRIWETQGDGPVVTMDAGANVHLLLRSDQTSRAEEWLTDLKAIRSWP